MSDVVDDLCFDIYKSRVTGKNLLEMSESSLSDCGFYFESEEELREFVNKIKDNAQELMGWTIK